MHRGTYAVWWEEGTRARHAGKLWLGKLHLLLTNGSDHLALPLEDIVAVDYVRGELHIQRRHDDDVRIGNLDVVGVLLELSDALAA